MRKILIMVMLCIGLGASAQEVYTSSGKPANAKKKEKKPEGFDISRLIVGGGIGLGFGSVTSISVSPIVGYRITDKLAAGVGFGYQYLKVKNYFEVEDLNGVVSYHDLKSSIVSASVWARYLILTNLFAQVEYEHNFMSLTEPRFSTSGSGAIEDAKVKWNAPSVLIGIGYRQPITENSSLYIMGMYDVLQHEYSPYKGGIFPRIGFNIGF